MPCLRRSRHDLGGSASSASSVVSWVKKVDDMEIPQFTTTLRVRGDHEGAP